MNREDVFTDHYILIYHPYHPRAVGEGYVPQQILVMENHLGRYLDDDEDVKHLNGNTHDNAIENLYLSSARREGRVSASLFENRDIAKRISKTFIGCRYQKPCWKEVRGPMARSKNVYLPYICSYQTEGDIYHCSRFWKFRSKEVEDRSEE